MPVIRGKDKDGCYFKWGEKGKHYYYTPGNESSRENAKNKAKLQGRAIHYSENKNFN